MALNKEKLFSNLKFAFGAQLLAFAVSALMSLILPKILAVEEFAYWQLFLLYGAYVPLFHFGLNDGVYLENGGLSLSNMNRSLITAEFFVGVAIECVVSILLFLSAMLLCDEPSRGLVVALLAVYVVMFYLGSYWGAVCQASNETHIFSKMQTIDKAVFFVLLLCGVLIRIDEFSFYIISYIISRTVADVYIIYRCRSFFFAGRLQLNESFECSVESIRVGIKLTISYLASIFILGAPRFVADGAWGIEEFGQLSFSISLMNFFIVFVNQVGMVLFPALKQTTEKEFKRLYLKLTTGLDLLLPLVYVLYYPIFGFVSWWLPQYSSGIIWLSILLPVCLYNSRMEVLSSVAMKVLRKEKNLMVINVTAAILSVLLATICGFCEMDHRLLIISIVAVTAGRSIVSEILVSRLVGLDNRFSIIVTFCLSILYLIISVFANQGLAAFAMLVVWPFLLLVKRRGKNIEQ